MGRRDQKELGNQYALKALKDKRATLAGEIILYQRKLAWAQRQIEHVDACLEIFRPGFDLTQISPKKPYKRVALFKQGELGRMIVDAIRRAKKSLTLEDVTTALLAVGGHDEGARRALKPRVRSGLEYLVRTERAAKQGDGLTARWALL